MPKLLSLTNLFSNRNLFDNNREDYKQNFHQQDFFDCLKFLLFLDAQLPKKMLTTS